MDRTSTIIAVITLLSAMLAGCGRENQAGPTRPAPGITNKAHQPKDSPPVTLTAGALAELKKLSAAGKKSWQITYNGTCSGAPVLGMYEVYADIPNNATVEKIDGIEFILDSQVMDMVPKWGPVFIRRSYQGSHDLSAGFAEKDPFQ